MHSIPPTLYFWVKRPYWWSRRRVEWRYTSATTVSGSPWFVPCPLTPLLTGVFENDIRETPNIFPYRYIPYRAWCKKREQLFTLCAISGVEVMEFK